MTGSASVCSPLHSLVSTATLALLVPYRPQTSVRICSTSNIERCRWFNSLLDISTWQVDQLDWRSTHQNRGRSSLSATFSRFVEPTQASPRPTRTLHRSLLAQWSTQPEFAGCRVSTTFACWESYVVLSFRRHDVSCCCRKHASPRARARSVPPPAPAVFGA